MASDFAMGQFRFLVPLLLVHGHWYQRMGYMVLYNFYRNATFVFVLFWAIYKVMGTRLFWALLLAVIVVGMIPHFAAKAIREHLIPSDIQIAREMEKSQDSHDATYPEVQMSTMARA